MKIISFNINGVRARIPQLSELINKHNPDIIGLQEIKVHNEAFPHDDIEALGYKAFTHGQKAHYGVALLVKQDIIQYVTNVRYGFPSDDENHQKRMIMITVKHPESSEEVTILNGYFPQGDNISHEIKFPYKRQFYKDLMQYLDEYHSNDEKLVVMGDINISPTDLDIGIGEQNRKRWLKTGKCSFQPEEREWLTKLLDWGFNDTFRELNPSESQKYSWFDYRSRGFDDNRGLRIDVILATANLMVKCTESDVDYELRALEKPSDHAPIWAVFN